MSAFGQWTLTQPRDRAEMQPPLPIDNPLMIPALAASTPPVSACASAAVGGHFDQGDDDKWLSQVEILTHFGPHRRLWMGPQFAFKTFQSSSVDVIDEMEEGLLDLDISLPNRPEQSNPVSVPTRSRGGGGGGGAVGGGSVGGGSGRRKSGGAQGGGGGRVPVGLSRRLSSFGMSHDFNRKCFVCVLLLYLPGFARVPLHPPEARPHSKTKQKRSIQKKSQKRTNIRLYIFQNRKQNL